MTKRGIAYIGLLALTLFLAFASGVREIFWVALFLSILLALAAVSVLLASFSISCRQQLMMGAIQRLDDVSMDITITGFLVFPALMDFGIMAPKSQTNGKIKFSMKKARMTRLSLPMGYFREGFSLEIACDHRGLWETIPHRVRVYDAFGIFCLPLLRPGAITDPEESLLVYPQLHPLDMDVYTPKYTTDSSTLRISVADFGDSYAGVRTYRPGDSMKRIHWIQTARTREIQTRQFEISSEPYVLLVLDAGIRSDRVDDYADIATECVAALAQVYVAAGQIVRLLVVGNPEMVEDLDLPIADFDDFNEAHIQLVQVPFSQQEGSLDMQSLRIDTAGQLQAAYIISDRCSDEIISSLNDLASNRCETSFVMPNPANKEEDIPVLEGTMIKLVVVPKAEEISERLGGGVRR